MPIEEWSKSLVLAPDDMINDAFYNTTQLAMLEDSDNYILLRWCLKSRFPFFKHPMLIDEFHTETFYYSIRSSQNHTSAKTLAGKDTGC